MELRTNEAGRHRDPNGNGEQTPRAGTGPPHRWGCSALQAQSAVLLGQRKQSGRAGGRGGGGHICLELAGEIFNMRLSSFQLSSAPRSALPQIYWKQSARERRTQHLHTVLVLLVLFIRLSVMQWFFFPLGVHPPAGAVDTRGCILRRLLLLRPNRAANRTSVDGVSENLWPQSGSETRF